MPQETTLDVHKNYEPNPNPSSLTSTPSKEVDYGPHPENSVFITPAHASIVHAITSLYSGSASESDMQVYAEKSIYDDPLSFCDTRYKIAGQWYGIPKLFNPSRTLATEIVSDTDDEIVFKLRQQYTPRGISAVVGTKGAKVVDSLVSLRLDGEGRVKYHKDMWNEKDYDHAGFGKIWKNLNGDHLTKVTRPPERLGNPEG